MPFKSEAQRRYLWANEPEIARDWTDTYGSKIQKAYGGRIGYYTGGQSIPSEYTVEDARKTAMQDKLGGITDIMKKADLYRQGDIGQMYMADGGRMGGIMGSNAGSMLVTPTRDGSRPGYYGPDAGHENDPGHGANAPSDDHSYKTHHPNIHEGMTSPSMTTAGTLSDLREKQDHFDQTWSGQPNFLGFGGYRNLKTPNDARSGYQSRLNPANILGILGGVMKKPFTFAATGFNSLRDTLGTGINTLRNKFSPVWTDWTAADNLAEFLNRRKTGETITNPAERGEYGLPAIEQEGYTDEDLEGIKDQESFLPSVIVQALAAAKSGASTKKIGEIILQDQIRKEMEKKMIKDPRSLIG